ncbi:MAG: glycosyltransferase, partial [Cyanobacteria bacterium P01_F01_bin.4]
MMADVGNVMTRAGLITSANGLGIVIAAFVVLSLVGMAAIAQRYLRLSHRFDPSLFPVSQGANEPPLITILKPLKGLEYELAKNLEAFVDLVGPAYEVLFGVADPTDPAVALVEALIAEYPEAPLRLIMTTAKPGFNPKMINLQGLEPHIRGELVLISDANTRPRRDSLVRLASVFQDPKVGYGCAPFMVRHAQTLGSRLRSLHIGSQLVSWMGGLYPLTGVAPIMGKWMVFRRQALRDIGGFAELSHYLAADGLTGQLLQPYGWQGTVIPDLMEISLNHWTLADAWGQLSRWGRLIRFLFPLGPLNLLAWNGSFWGLMGLLWICLGAVWGGGALIGAGGLCWLGLSIIYGWRGGDSRDLWLLPLLDWQQMATVVWAYCGTGIAW